VINYPIRSNLFRFQVEISKHLCGHRSRFQQIDIYDTPVFGKMLLLDGHIQLSALDEAAYHEALVHIPALSIRELRRALVIGAGDGGVLRELCKHESLETIDMVEIDQDVVDLCRKHLPELSDGAFDDPRVNLKIADATEFVRECPDWYDLIVLDVTDSYEEDPSLSEEIFDETFYSKLAAMLAIEGMVVTQADNPVACPYSQQHISGLYRKVFPVVQSYWALVPSFGGFSGFVVGSKGAQLAPTWHGLRPAPIPTRYLNRTTYDLALSPLPFTR
jgi:spermidine synthase